MSIFDMFRSGGSSNAAAEGVSQAPEGAEGAQQQAPQTPQSGGGTGEEGSTQGQVSGLEAFKDLWDNSTEGNEGDDLSAYDPSASLNVDPEAIQQAVSQIDFSQVLDPQTLSQISEGGEQAQQAFAKSMNSLAQHVFSQSMIANATLVKQALGKSTEAFDRRAQQMVRHSDVSKEVQNANPAFKHPSAKPIVESMQYQLQRKYPQASPQEIAQKAQQWFEEFANEMRAPERAAEQQRKSANEPDWEAFFNS